jgi:hypothetical protein
MMRSIKTLYKGEKFGKFSILETSAKQKISCICDCGKVLEVDKWSLILGKSKGCGKGICNTSKVDFTGRRFANIIVIELDESVEETSSDKRWRCLCDCGNYCIVKSSNLKRNRAKSCGCQAKIIKSKKLSLPDGEVNVRNKFSVYRICAKKRKLEFNITLEQFRGFLFKNCFYCGSSPKSISKIKNLTNENCIIYNGIDRVDNNVGYIIGNCVTCCIVCNRAKSNQSYDDFILWINNLIKFRNEIVEIKEIK